jgi:YidC/Oxa1 family membrane protein insertase
VDRRFALFAVLVALIFVINQIIFSYLNPPQPPNKVAEKSEQQVAKAEQQADEAKQPKDAVAGEAAAAQDAPVEAEAEQPAPAAEAKQDSEPETKIETKRGTLGSIDRESPFRMLVTWNNEGAAIEKIELNQVRALESDIPWGYLGYLAPVDAPGKAGALVRVVGTGTPAATAGVEAGDIITALGGTTVRTATAFLKALETTEPHQQIKLTIQRGDKTKDVEVTLGQQPLDLVRPEFESKPVEIVTPGKHDPLSFLTTIQQFDDRILANDNKELGGVNLRDGAWEVTESTLELVRFQRQIPLLGLEVIKTYRLAEVPKKERADETFPAYHLTLDVSLKNISDAKHKVAYRLDGPTGLPIEGAWFANKVSHTWGSAGLRDVIAMFDGNSVAQVSPGNLAEDDFEKSWGSTSQLDFIAVDAQYFSVALIPQSKQPDQKFFELITPIRAGAVPEKSADKRLLNVSFRIDSVMADLAPGESLQHSYQVFAGPKRRALLAHYGPNGDLTNLIYFGLFSPIARVLSGVLHAFYAVVHNYGIAIVMLTVLVRGCMFPLSRKQALGAQKMQELQPEMKKINEKYKNDAEKRTRAMQELFRHHSYNPVGGCLLAFAQLPIFVGLYRSLMVDVELRQAPLISDAIRWASNLAAPDMFWNWAHIMPAFVSGENGWLGPYLNVLPLVTIGLFIWQQKMFMPPPADEQAAMQQKMMQYMMIFMGVLFFKVASGLCVYFIASSLWGVAERKLLPKVQKKTDADAAPVAPMASPDGNGAAARRRRQKGRK